ncbi:MAG: Ribosomal RNA small subunit methyltransferase A [Mycoplasmataceae bacterium]|nr:MAG: Ribosomal RNA small subunit methyltransferase A [Mycoplasmataceae bacterium]
MISNEHLNYKEKINNGAFYTPKKFVQYVWEMISPFLNEEFIILDSSAGNGSFLTENKKEGLSFVAGEIDKVAIDYLKDNFPWISTVHKNALINVNRSEYGISENQKLLIIGNPPYNDFTSIKAIDIKKKKKFFDVDDDIKSRDLGISFLRSYNKLRAEYVCVLHPLSYLIKKTNFLSLKEFAKNYKLIDALVIDSKDFSDTKGSSFPISISLFKRDEEGMDYEYIKNFSFKLENGKKFSLNEFSFINNLVGKYPKKKEEKHLDNIFFFTFRDINSVFRNRTFIEKESKYSVPIKKEEIKYYAFIDYFKKTFKEDIPFYLRNFDVFYDSDFNESDWEYFEKKKLDFCLDLKKTDNIYKFEKWVKQL